MFAWCSKYSLSIAWLVVNRIYCSCYIRRWFPHGCLGFVFFLSFFLSFFLLPPPPLSVIQQGVISYYPECYFKNKDLKILWSVLSGPWGLIYLYCHILISVMAAKGIKPDIWYWTVIFHDSHMFHSFVIHNNESMTIKPQKLFRKTCISTVPMIIILHNFPHLLWATLYPFHKFNYADNIRIIWS